MQVRESGQADVVEQQRTRLAKSRSHISRNRVKSAFLVVRGETNCAGSG